MLRFGGGNSAFKGIEDAGVDTPSDIFAVQLSERAWDEKLAQ